MGAAESANRAVAAPATPSSPSAPSPLFPVDHPLHLLLNPAAIPPIDPESQFYVTLFSDFLAVARTTSNPLTPLISHALAEPTSNHAVALSTSVRAAVHHLRLEPNVTQLGALHFVRAVLSDLHRLASSPVEAYLALAAGPAEVQLQPSDRVDLARSLRIHLIHASLQLVSVRTDTPFAPQFTAVAVPLLLLVLSHESHTNNTTFALDFSAFENASSVIVTLLDVVVQAAEYTSPLSQLSFGVPTTNTLHNQISTDAGSVWDAWDSFAASAPAVHLKNGFADVVSVISSVSQRLKISKWSDGGLPHGGLPHGRVLDPTQPLAASMSDHSIDHNAHEPSITERPDSTNGTNVHNLRDFDHGANAQQGDGPADVDAFSTSRATLAEQALVLLDVLCRPHDERNPFSEALSNLRDVPCESSDGDVDEVTIYSFSKLYETLGLWMADPKGALLGYYLFVRNRSFRTFALARTDPDVIVMPILASLRARCVIGAVPADGYVVATMLLALTSDKGFCEAIDSIAVPESWSRFLVDRVRLAGDQLMMSGAVLIVCARVVQQSLVMRRERAECYLSAICLAIMGNVAKDATNLHSFVAERVVSLVEFLGRRRKRAVSVFSSQRKAPMEPPRVGDDILQTRKSLSMHMKSQRNSMSPRAQADVASRTLSGEKNKVLVERLSEFIGMNLEIIVALLRARSTVAVNRHLVYAVMHREGVFDGEHIGGCNMKARALVHMIGRMVHFFGALVDRRNDGTVDGRSGRRSGAVGISVERVFQVIEENSRILPSDVFDGVPEKSFSYREGASTDHFLDIYAFTLLNRFWKSHDSDDVDTGVGVDDELLSRSLGSSRSFAGDVFAASQ